MVANQLDCEAALWVVGAFINVKTTALRVTRVLDLAHDCLFLGQGVNRQFAVLRLPVDAHELLHFALDWDLLVGNEVSLFCVEKLHDPLF